MAWLLSRGYPPDATLKLVGDRFGLTARQRLAVMRSSCSDQALQSRRDRELTIANLTGRTLDIDGFNLLTTVEAALSGGVILRGRDGCLRDLAGMHGNYRKVLETQPAIELIGSTLAELQIAFARWLLDQPVSNSGRLAKMLRETAAQRGWNWRVELVPSPDRLLRQTDRVVVSSDSAVLDACGSWCNLAAEIVPQRVAATILELADGHDRNHDPAPGPAGH